MAFTPKISEKTWNPNIELEILEKWEKEEIYRFNRRARKRFSIDTPPPYPSGRPWHIGAAAQYSQIDMIARTARMKGYSTLFPIGIDRNGLPVEIFTEKRYGVSIKDVSREKFLELCSTSLDELETEMIAIMKRLGLSCDFKNKYRTDSPDYRAMTQSTFIKLWKKGLVYQASRPNNYCYICGTTLADAEVEYELRPSELVYIRFGLEDGGGIVIATTRPELLGACRAVIVNPSDERYTALHGRRAIVPIYNTRVPIIPHPSARPDFGTGAVMVCSYGDYNDVRLFRELGLEESILIGEDGRMNEKAGALKGLTIHEARREIKKILENAGLIVKVDEIMHNTPICERSKTPIEILSMPEYYLKQLEFAPVLSKLSSKIRFHPKHMRQLLLDWISSITIDWPLSRRRYYATEIPVWYCRRCGQPYIPNPGKYYRPWREPPPIKKCSGCGGEDFIGDERTFDTWMDSSISALYIISNRVDGRIDWSLYPISIRPQGKDIVRTWLYYSLLRCYQLTGKMPFRSVWIGGLGLDEHGEKMSKSKGNVIDPLPILEKYGADCFRFWTTQESNLGEDFRISESRIAGSGKFLTKLWNIARYISAFPYPRRATLTPTDKWILSELSITVEKCIQGFDELNFFIPSTTVRDFVWNIFASHYLEMSKPRAYAEGFSASEQRAAWYTLHTVLKTVLLLLAPITPFITDRIWLQLYGRKSIHLSHFPKPVWSRRYARYTKDITDFNSKIWNMKKSSGLSLRDEISAAIPPSLKPFEKDLKAMHRLVDK
ncbi:Valine--tRNA ligase [archaeon HR01]|nr:Valine--tRNA ligase [archaeon HR01]